MSEHLPLWSQNVVFLSGDMDYLKELESRLLMAISDHVHVFMSDEKKSRFLIIADPLEAPYLIRHDNINKASLVFTLPHTQGSLSKILTIFSFYDINLSKIQSLPIIGREWEYRFYINLTFNDYVRYRQSIDAVKPLINEFKILGEYNEFVYES